MEPLLILGILLVGMIAGGVLASFLFKGSGGPNLAASEAEIGEFKARIEERDQAIKELRRQVEEERGAAGKLQQQIVEVVSDRKAAEERASNIPKLEAQIAEKEAALSKLNEENSNLKARHAALMTRIDEVEKSQVDKLKTLEEAQTKMAETFKGVAAEALASNNQNFLALAQSAFQGASDVSKGDLENRQKSIDDTLKPLKEALERIEKNRTESFAGLSEQLKLLHSAQTKVEAETSKLVNALRAPTVRGRWGEMQLRRVVELAGMVEYCDFEQQVSVDTEGGKLRPDMIIRLPNHREIVVDSKVSLAAYLDSVDLIDEGARHAKLAEHAAQVRQHIVRLSAKSYWDQFEHAPDFVVAFLPGETFFSAALQKDPELIEFGVNNRVLLSTPTTLIALLKAVAYGWRQEKLTQNAQQISDLGKELYDRLRTFGGYMDGIRGGLERSVESYNKAVGSLESRVLVSARRFKDLSAATGDEIPLVDVVEKTPRALETSDLALLAAASTNGSPGIE
jgi:DNA recombination protein RmuC